MRTHCSITALSTLLVLVTGPSLLAEKPSRKPAAARLEVLLTTGPMLSGAARRSMMAEAAAIWEEQGVVIDWREPTVVRPVAPNRLRVLVVERRQPEGQPGEPFAVGELIRPADSHALA